MQDFKRIRKNVRLKNFDYSSNGYYHITICSKEKQFVFGTVKATNNGAAVELSAIGKFAESCAWEIEQHYGGIKIVCCVIMPNHVHILLQISNGGCNGRQVAAPTVSRIIAQYKRAVSKQAGRSVWQKGYYDHIIRNNDDLYETILYIKNNPVKWLISNK